MTTNTETWLMKRLGAHISTQSRFVDYRPKKDSRNQSLQEMP